MQAPEQAATYVAPRTEMLHTRPPRCRRRSCRQRTWLLSLLLLVLPLPPPPGAPRLRHQQQRPRAAAPAGPAAVDGGGPQPEGSTRDTAVATARLGLPAPASSCTHAATPGVAFASLRQAHAGMCLALHPAAEQRMRARAPAYARCRRQRHRVQCLQDRSNNLQRQAAQQHHILVPFFTALRAAAACFAPRCAAGCDARLALLLQQLALALLRQHALGRRHQRRRGVHDLRAAAAATRSVHKRAGRVSLAGARLRHA